MTTHLGALVRAGARFENGTLVERPDRELQFKSAIEVLILAPADVLFDPSPVRSYLSLKQFGIQLIWHCLELA